MWEFLRAAIELLLTATGYFRFITRKGQSRSWPVAQGTIQPCRVEKGLNFLSPFRYYSVFGYAFKANAARYAGFFLRWQPMMKTQRRHCRNKHRERQSRSATSPAIPTLHCLKTSRSWGGGLFRIPTCYAEVPIIRCDCKTRMPTGPIRGRGTRPSRTRSDFSVF